VEERQKRGVLCNIIVNSKRFPDLVHLYTDEWIVGIAICMILCYDLTSFIIAIFGDEPTWRFDNRETPEDLDYA
jgi:hypothetical protein